MIIGHELLEKTCKNMIETILLCLDHATKGTIYRIGPLPELRSVRVTCGIREPGNGTIRWGLPTVSDYNPPGKTWLQYQDQPGRALEAMGWCVERQKSWTADDPDEDQRSVRKQLSGEPEDWHHMEPVLVKKADLYGQDDSDLDYPCNWKGKPIWQDSDYVVVAVIKIHFLPHTIRRGDRATKVIKKLSRVLGTEMFSLHIRESVSQVQQELASERMASCNAVAHELRNTLTKLSFIFSAINAEISFLREQWEEQIFRSVGEVRGKTSILVHLNQILLNKMAHLNGNRELGEVARSLAEEQNELAALPLLPEQAERWVSQKIRPKWQRLLEESPLWTDAKEEVQSLLDQLGKALWIGTDENLAKRLDHLPEELRRHWPRLAYVDFSVDKLPVLEEILQLLQHPDMPIPHKTQTHKVLSSLKALVEIIPEMETRANRILESMRNGSGKDLQDYWKDRIRNGDPAHP
ncbi:hypothetical protein SAMN02746041_01048 [Desulfacinum hydrothermale DSM 13146]|uniref:Uncharacterized protein n=1 Tax=Desulfacinum hydrothermale DSM 13146 TaxID=1121390 RepID=A0A1W1XAD5_9BACT|nr:hypothetical protein [Desulfacinum hydrothermale]SMC20916.1 hypothetical protein SAMN02746041_01048 [Desulfacinum hydrothermale DSM 13146]